MNLPDNPPVRRRIRAFTLSELMVTMAVFTILMAGLMASHLMGLRMRKTTDTKLSATANARRALNDIRNEVRTAKMLSVGTGTKSTFTAVPTLSQQVGNALQIYATTNSNIFVRYYMDASEEALMRVTSSDTTPRQVAGNITNQLVFAAEDFKGNVLTNNQNNRVIRMMLEFYQKEYTLAKGPDRGVYDYYRVQTRITRRAIE
jgi:prepilin-type N-terminal cleavage/methylation domain-containing protein